MGILLKLLGHAKKKERSSVSEWYGNRNSKKQVKLAGSGFLLLSFHIHPSAAATARSNLQRQTQRRRLSFNCNAIITPRHTATLECYYSLLVCLSLWVGWCLASCSKCTLLSCDDDDEDEERKKGKGPPLDSQHSPLPDNHPPTITHQAGREQLPSQDHQTHLFSDSTMNQNPILESPLFNLIVIGLVWFVSFVRRRTGFL